MMNLLLPFLVLIVFITSYFTVWQKDLSFPLVSTIVTMIFALPALVGVLKWLGLRFGFLLLISLGIFSYFIETIGLVASFPYGSFTYSQNVGLLFFNFMPISLPFAWVPLIIGAFVFSSRYKNNFFLHLGVFLLYIILIDLILDPGAVFLGFWTYSEKGLWYGVPLTNYFGWVISGTVGFLIMKYFTKQVKKNPKSYIYLSYMLSLAFWTGVCFFAHLFVPALIGMGLTIWLSIKMR